MKNKDFNYKEFKRLINSGDIFGLDYLYRNEIKDYSIKEPRELYIYNLYKATYDLNICISVMEEIEFKNNFEYDIYYIVRNKLLEELGFNIEELYN
jgi:hypothetical protein